MFRVVLQTRDELCHRMAIKADLVNSGEKRKPAEAGRRELLKAERVAEHVEPLTSPSYFSDSGSGAPQPP